MVVAEGPHDAKRIKDRLVKESDAEVVVTDLSGDEIDIDALMGRIRQGDV